MIDRLLIIGAGRIGRTIHNLLLASGHQAMLTMWDKNPQLVPGQLPLASLVPPADMVFVCTPSWTVRDVLQEIKPLLQPTTRIVTLAKGIEASGLTMAEVVPAELPQQPFGVLGGPLLAEALEHGHRGIGVVGTTDNQLTAQLQALFERTPVTIVGPMPPVDVARCGYLKNVYAFIVGMLSGLHASAAERRQGYERARSEFLAVGAALGIRQDVLAGPAGVGDFEETATSPSSHNFHCGADSAAHNAIVCTSEGTISATKLTTQLGRLERWPLLDHLVKAMAGKVPVNDIGLVGQP